MQKCTFSELSFCQGRLLIVKSYCLVEPFHCMFLQVNQTGCRYGHRVTSDPYHNPSDSTERPPAHCTFTTHRSRDNLTTTTTHTPQHPLYPECQLSLGSFDCITFSVHKIIVIIIAVNACSLSVLLKRELHIHIIYYQLHCFII